MRIIGARVKMARKKRGFTIPQLIKEKENNASWLFSKKAKNENKEGGE